MRFDLTDIRLFLEVVESKSITVGGKRMNLALATASTRIRNMEEAIGTKLLERLHRGVQPTPAGQALIRHARIIIQQLDGMDVELGEYAKNRRKTVHVLADTAAAFEFLPDMLASFLASHPHFDIDLNERPSYKIVQAIMDGLVDIGIIADTADPQGVETFPLSVDRLVLVVPAGHRLSELLEVSFRLVADQSFVGLTQDRALHEYIRENARWNGHALTYRICVRSFEEVCKIVAHGVGVAIVSEAAAQRYQAMMPISVVPLTDHWAIRNLRICVRRSNLLSAHVRALLEHFQNRASG
ncbi:LysR substrate-binding domain-containing protein [Bradyrhizobium sp. USDA 4508]